MLHKSLLKTSLSACAMAGLIMFSHGTLALDLEEIQRRVEYLGQLHEKGLIDEAEYRERRSAVLDLLTAPKDTEALAGQGQAAADKPWAPAVQPGERSEGEVSHTQLEPVFVGTWSIQRMHPDRDPPFDRDITRRTWVFELEGSTLTFSESLSLVSSESVEPKTVSHYDYDEDEITFTVEEQGYDHRQDYFETTTRYFMKFDNPNRASGRYHEERFTTRWGHSKSSGILEAVRIRAERPTSSGTSLPGLTLDAPLGGLRMPSLLIPNDPTALAEFIIRLDHLIKDSQGQAEQLERDLVSLPKNGSVVNRSFLDGRLRGTYRNIRELQRQRSEAQAKLNRLKQ